MWFIQPNLPFRHDASLQTPLILSSESHHTNFQSENFGKLSSRLRLLPDWSSHVECLRVCARLLRLVCVGHFRLLNYFHHIRIPATPPPNMSLSWENLKPMFVRAYFCSKSRKKFSFETEEKAAMFQETLMMHENTNTIGLLPHGVAILSCSCSNLL